jgi:hypothetical protein
MKLDYYTHKSSEPPDRLQEKLPILDWYFNLSNKDLYEYRNRVFTGKVYRWHCVEICLFRRAFVVTLKVDRPSICPVVAKQLYYKQRKENYVE